MSKRLNGVQISAPLFGVGKEKPEEFPGYSCGYCQGNGWFIDPDVIHERVKKPCPSCGGTGQVKAIVTVEWVADGEVKPYFKEK